MNTRRRSRDNELRRSKKNRLASGAALVAAVTLLLSACAGVEQPSIDAACDGSSESAQSAWLQGEDTAFILGSTQYLDAGSSHAIAAWMGIDETGCFINFSLTNDKEDLSSESRLASVESSRSGSAPVAVAATEGYRNESIANFRLHLDDFYNSAFTATFRVTEGGTERDVARSFELVREVAHTAESDVQMVTVDWR